MKTKVIITFEFDTEIYSNIPLGEGPCELVRAMLQRECDFPNTVAEINCVNASENSSLPVHL